LSRAWTKLINTQLKDVTSDDLAKLGQLMFVDPKAIAEFEQLSLLTKTAQNLQTPGQEVFADSIKIYAASAESSVTTIKPSDIYPNDPYADTYLVKILGYAMTSTNAAAAADISIMDASTVVPIVTATRPFEMGTSFQPTNLYLNESNYLVLTEAGGDTVILKGVYGIVARGGAQ